MSNLLTKEQILGAQDLQKERVEVPEWGGAVMVRGLSAKERDAYEAGVLKINRKGQNEGLNLINMRARLAAMAICDDQGQRLFSDADVEALGKKSSSALQRVFEVAQRLSLITDEDIEELEKNSESALADDSSTS